MSISFLSFSWNSLIQLRSSWPPIIRFQHSHFFGWRCKLRINFKSISVFIMILFLSLLIFRLGSNLTFGHSLRSVICIGNAIRNLGNLPGVITVRSTWRRFFKQLSTYIATSLVVKEVRSPNLMILHWILPLNNIAKPTTPLLIAHPMPNTKRLGFIILRLYLDLIVFFVFSLDFLF